MTVSVATCVSFYPTWKVTEMGDFGPTRDIVGTKAAAAVLKGSRPVYNAVVGYVVDIALAGRCQEKRNEIRST
jgi:hypothetical protein